MKESTESFWHHLGAQPPNIIGKRAEVYTCPSIKKTPFYFIRKDKSMLISELEDLLGLSFFEKGSERRVFF
ncbi:hypothetical protein KR52_00250 [Synechococcus sp. KORDI-52]|nr:hypothetical protein KR52_00250 [Synechococcus sp. KORDI-52]